MPSAGRNDALAGVQIASVGTVQLTASGRTSVHCPEPGSCCSTARETVCPAASEAVAGTTRKAAVSAAAKTSTRAVAVLFK